MTSESSQGSSLRRATGSLPKTRAVLGGRYELLFELASGGMGTVYVGRRLGPSGFQRLVAIKRMHPSIVGDPDSVDAFMDEARIASLVQHANVVAIHDVQRDGEEHLLVMDYIDGASLAVLLGSLRRAGKRISRRVGLRIVCDALRGLHAAHELVGLDGRPLELVHRDATPHNILLGVDGSVRLTDFGIARVATRTVHTDPGFAKGKYAYMAPEQAFAEPLDRRADVFAMGVVAWETLTGRRLFENRTMHEVARGIALGEIRAPSAAGAGTPPELDAIVLRALAPWREHRYATAAAFADALYAFASGEGGLAPSSAVADVLDLACGPLIRERRDRVREVLQSTCVRSVRPPAQEASRHALAAPAPEETRISLVDRGHPANDGGVLARPRIAGAEALVEHRPSGAPALDRATPTIQDPPRSLLDGVPAATAARIATPSSLSRDVPAPEAEPRPIRRRLRVLAIVLATSSLALGLGLALGGAERPPPRAGRIAVHTTAAFQRAHLEVVRPVRIGAAPHAGALPSPARHAAPPTRAQPPRAPRR